MYQQQHPPQSAADSLPTMYDLPSEDPEELGLPDEFHDFQPKLLRETCQVTTYPASEIFMGADLNLYYDVRHTQWYKRPELNSLRNKRNLPNNRHNWLNNEH